MSATDEDGRQTGKGEGMGQAEMITRDTGERVTVPALPPRGCGDGYDWMEAAEEGEQWGSLAAWGRDGYDLGDWPYVIVLVHVGKDSAGTFTAVAVYCEGDVEIEVFRTRAATRKRITETAFFYWKHQGHGPENLPETADELPEELTVPYTGWQG